MTSLLLLVLLL